MKNLIHRFIGFIVSRKCVYTLLTNIAMRDPDSHIMSPDGTSVYMFRWWLFNRITDRKRKYPWIKRSARVHLIMRKDLDRDMHDHPWKARTYIMRSGYDEVRLEGWRGTFDLEAGDKSMLAWRGDYTRNYRRMAGDTSTLDYEKYHRITRIHDEARGALTLFIFGEWQGDWGFRVNGKKVLRRDYEKLQRDLDDIIADMPMDDFTTMLVNTPIYQPTRPAPPMPAIKPPTGATLDFHLDVDQVLHPNGNAVGTWLEAGHCRAIVYSGQVECACGNGWGYGDEDRPACKPLNMIQPTKPWPRS